MNDNTNDTTNDLDRTREETLAYEEAFTYLVSDEALEAAATGGRGAGTACSFVSAPCC
jgi:hypothetical protein